MCYSASFAGQWISRLGERGNLVASGVVACWASWDRGLGLSSVWVEAHWACGERVGLGSSGAWTHGTVWVFWWACSVWARHDSWWKPGGPAGPRPGRPEGGPWPTCSFCASWCAKAFHGLWVQGAEVSVLPGALPQSSLSPAPQQGPWLPELTQSMSVFQLPFWIFFINCSLNKEINASMSPGRSSLFFCGAFSYSFFTSFSMNFYNLCLCSVLCSGDTRMLASSR
jgi:hypothetical protein